MAGLQSRLAPMGLPEHKLTPVEQVHITLVFLGDRRATEVADIEESIAGACKGIRACVVRPVRLISLPEKGAARLVAAETDAPPPLLELQKRLAHRLAARDKRGGEFLPHLTLCRFTGMGADVRVRQDVEDGEGFAVQTVCLVKSVLHPLGARHVLIREFGLG